MLVRKTVLRFPQARPPMQRHHAGSLDCVMMGLHYTVSGLGCLMHALRFPH